MVNRSETLSPRKKAEVYLKWDVNIRNTTTLQGYAEPMEGYFGVGVMLRGRRAGMPPNFEPPILKIAFTPSLPTEDRKVDELLDLTPDDFKALYGTHTVWSSDRDPNHRVGEYSIGHEPQLSLTELGLVDPYETDHVKLPLAADIYLGLPVKVQDEILKRVPPMTRIPPPRVSVEEAERMRQLAAAGVEMLPGAAFIDKAIEAIVEPFRAAAEDARFWLEHFPTAVRVAASNPSFIRGGLSIRQIFERQHRN